MPQTRSVRLWWSGEGLRFAIAGSEPESPAIKVDGDGEAGPSPMQVLLGAAASCAASDVVLILEKMRVDLASLSAEAIGTRRDREPRRYEAIEFRFTGSGEGLTSQKLERAVGLSLEKYCSVVSTLASDVSISYECRVE